MVIPRNVPAEQIHKGYLVLIAEQVFRLLITRYYVADNSLLLKLVTLKLAVDLGDYAG